MRLKVQKYLTYYSASKRLSKHGMSDTAVPHVISLILFMILFILGEFRLACLSLGLKKKYLLCTCLDPDILRLLELEHTRMTTCSSQLNVP